MHSLNGGWIGQTFALAKRNESEGRKSRIRRSKEERKEMVESFIKNYQESNNGKFPSLNLTHKEVGGSFYTVREIVRDIIQENRVLGPAKFTLEELASDQFLEQNPLGSIAKDPQAYLATSSNETHFEPSNHQDTNQETLLVSDGLFTGVVHQMVNNGHVINGSQVSVLEKDSIGTTSTELQANENLAPKQDVELELETPTTKVTTVTADVIVETFPLRPVTRATDSMEEGDGELRYSSNSQEKEMKSLELERGEKISNLNGVESADNIMLFDDKYVDDHGNLQLKENSCFGGEEILGDTLVDSTKHSAHNEHFAHDFKGCQDLKSRIPQQSTITSESIPQSEMVDGVKTSDQAGLQTKNLTNTYTGRSKSTEAGLENVNENMVNGQLCGSTEERSNPSLDRINLESWDGTRSNSGKQEPNPLLAIFRALVDAFVRFWSE